MRGAPTALEVAAFAWLIAPILLSWFLSRTGRYEGAHVLSSLALAGLVMMVAVHHRRHRILCRDLAGRRSAGSRALGLAPRGGVCLRAGAVMRRRPDRARPFRHAAGAGCQLRRSRGVLMAFGVASATLYAAGLAFGAELLARTSVALLYVEEDRYRLLARNMSDVISRHRRNGAVQFISPAVEAMLGTPVARLLGHGLFDRVHVADRPAYLTALVRCRARRRGAQRRIPSAARCRARTRTIPPISSGSKCAAGRSSRCQSRRSRGRRRDARRHRPQDAGAGARAGAHRRRAGRRVKDPLPRHHEPRAAHAAQRHHRLLRDDRCRKIC